MAETKKVAIIGKEPERMAALMAVKMSVEYAGIKFEEDVNDRDKWVNFGEENDIPDKYVEMFLNSPVHSDIVSGTADMIFGRGFVPTEENAELKSEESVILKNFMSRPDQFGQTGEQKVRQSCQSMKMNGGVYLKIHWSEDRESIAFTDILPFSFCRLAKKDSEGRIKGVYYCEDWEDSRKEKKFYPIFNKKTRTEEGHGVQVLWVHLPLLNGVYYPQPDYFASSAWIDLDKNLVEFFNNYLLNGMTPSFHINFPDGKPDKKTRKEVRKEIDGQMTGPAKAGKAFISFSNGAEKAPTLTPLSIDAPHDQFSTLKTMVREEIFFGHKVTSPMLFGIKDKSGLGNNADELQTAQRLYERAVIHPYQAILSNAWTSIFELMGIQTRVKLESLPIDYQPEKDASDETTAAKKSLKRSYKIIPSGQHNKILLQLQRRGRKKDDLESDGWKHVLTMDVDVEEHDKSVAEIFQLAIESDPWSESGLDFPNEENGEWLVRYQYDGPLDSRNRAFCRDVMMLNLIYRKEDIDMMSFRNENGEFGRYSIFLYKGSYGCRHRWKRLIFYRDFEDQETRRVGNVPGIIGRLRDAVATALNPKPKRN